MQFHLTSRMHRWLWPDAIAPLFGALLLVAVTVTVAHAQGNFGGAGTGNVLSPAIAPPPEVAFVWGGPGSTTATSDYSTGTNWSPGSGFGPPPALPSQSAIFGSTGSSTVTIGNNPFAPGATVLPDAWTFTTDAQSYSIGPGVNNTVEFSLAGPTGGIINKANAGQTITISVGIEDGLGGPIQVQQLGHSTLVLSVANGYSGGTLISAGTVQVTDANSLGSGVVTLNGGTLQMQWPTVSSIGISNNFAINAPGGTVDANGAQVNLSGIISDGAGAGVLRLTDSVGGGSVQLSGINTYSGGTLVSGTTVIVSNNSAVGTGTVTLDDSSFQADGLSNLTFTNNFKINSSTFGSALDANGTTLTIAGNISGTGKLTILDSTFSGAPVVLTGTNTYTGGTTICDCATLQLGDATHTASLVGAVTNFGIFNIVNADTSGITSITNDNEFIIPGLTTFFSGTSASNIAITNKNGGETDFVGNATAGNATILNRTDGLTTFNAFATAGSATITNLGSGYTVFYDGSTAGSANITNLTLHHAGGLVLFYDNSSAANATITNNSNGLGGIPVGVAFFDNSTAGNATIINNGAIAFGFPGGFDTATAGNANITNNNGGMLQFDAFTTAGNATITTQSGGAVAFFDNSTGGNAQFITNGTGYVDFGQSIGLNSDHQISAGSIAGSGLYYIGGGNTLTVGSNNLSTTVSGVIADNNPCGCTSGSGSLVKVGSGELTLSGANTYTGTTAVNGGFLDVEGSIASSSLLTVNSGGALTGGGIVGNTVIGPGGIFLPGNGAVPSTTVSGNLALQSGALYLVQLNSTGSTFASVTGTATLGGNVGASLTPGSTVLKQYMILQAAGGVSGAFDGATVTPPGGLVASLSYDPTHAYLNLELNYAAKNNLNVNQQNVANTLTNFFNANGGIPAVFASLTPSGLTQASGEIATGSQQATFDAMNQFMSLLTDPTISGRSSGAPAAGGPQGYAEEGTLSYAAQNGTARDAFAKIPTKAIAPNDLLDNRWSVWGSAFGGSANISGNAALGSNSADVRAFGFAAGADYRISPVTLAGFALAGGGTNFSVSGLGTGRSDMFQAGAFVRHTVGAAYVTGALAYGGQNVTTDRTVTAGGFEHLQAQFNTNSWSGRLEGGYRYATPWMGITPYVAGQFTTIDLPAYAEQVLAGTGNFALNYAAKTATDARSELGVRTDKSLAMSNGILTLRGRAAWAHDFDTDRNVSALFQSLPGTFFVVNGAAQAHDSALTTASAEMRWMNGWSAALTFEGEFSPISSSYAGKGVVRYTW